MPALVARRPEGRRIGGVAGSQELLVARDEAVALLLREMGASCGSGLVGGRFHLPQQVFEVLGPDLAVLLFEKVNSRRWWMLRWVGRWRGTVISALFHWPPSELYVHLSAYTALRSFMPIPSAERAVLSGWPHDRGDKQQGSFFGVLP